MEDITYYQLREKLLEKYKAEMKENGVSSCEARRLMYMILTLEIAYSEIVLQPSYQMLAYRSLK